MFNVSSNIVELLKGEVLSSWDHLVQSHAIDVAQAYATFKKRLLSLFWHDARPKIYDTELRVVPIGKWCSVQLFPGLETGMPCYYRWSPCDNLRLLRVA